MQTRFTIGAILGLLVAATAFAGCVQPEESVNEDTGPGDETGDIRDDEDTARGESNGNETGADNGTTDASGDGDDTGLY